MTVGDVDERLILVAQSMGAFTAALVAEQINLPRKDFDPVEDFFHDVPTRVIAGSNDRLFPVDFQRRPAIDVRQSDGP